MLTLQTLGPARLIGPAGELLRGRRKELALLAYLARRRHHPVTRDALADLLWGDRPEANARQSLRQALMQLKRAVTTGFDAESDAVTLSPEALELDVACFEADLEAGRLEQAVDRWHGDFLSGLEDAGGSAFRVWLEAEREALRQRLHAALAELTGEADRGRDPETALRWAERWSGLFPLNEDAAERLIRTLRRAGRIAEARARHAAFVARLREDLELEPSPSFVRLGEELTAERRPARPTPASGALFTPEFVGRDAALATLTTAWTTAVGGTTVVTLIQGDEGIGKTRLCEEFVRTLPAGAVVLRARGTEASREEALSVLRELLAGLAHAPGLAGARPAALAAVAGVAPSVLERFPSATADGGAAPLEEGVADVLTAVATEAPVLILVDDYPWADRESSDLLRLVMRRLRHAPVCIVLACRTDDTPPALLAEMRGRVGETRIRLTPLSAADVEALLGSMLEIAPDVRPALVDRLRSESGGNPFYLIETTAALLDEGRIAQDEHGRWRPAGTMTDAALPVPPSIRDAARRRFDALSPMARRLAEAAAVLAMPAPSDRLARVARLSEPDAEAALEELLLRRVFRSLHDRANAYEFMHEVARRSVLDRIPSSRRRQLHRAALRALRDAPAGEDIPAVVLDYHRRRSRSGGGVAAIAGVGLTLALAAAWFVWGRAPAGFAERDWILLADLDNASGDSLFDQSLTAALFVSISQSQHVNVFPPARVRETLRRMQRDSVRALTETLAREVALREGIRAVVTLSIAAEGGQYPLAARVVDPETGSTVASVRALARDRSQILAALDEIGTGLRRTLGESMGSIRRRSISLPQASTASLEALRRFAEGTRAIDAGRSADAVAALRAAILLDPEFAWAHAVLGRYFDWINIPDSAAVHLNRALALTDRLPERERLWVRRVIAQGRGDDAEAVRLSREYVAQYPDDRDAWTVLGRALQEAGDRNGALEAYRRVLQIDPRESSALVNSAVLFDLTGRPFDAVTAFERAAADDPSLVTQIAGDLNRIYGFSLLRTGDSARARVVFRRALEGTGTQQANGLRSLGLYEMYYGRYGAAITHFARAVELSSNSPISEMRNRLYLVTALSTLGDTAARRQQLAAAQAIRRKVSVPPTWLAFLGQHLARAGWLDEADNVLDSVTVRIRPENKSDRAAGELVRGEIALARGNPAAAAEAFDLAIQLNGVNYERLGLARAQAAMGRIDDATATYRAMLQDSALGWEVQEPWVLAHYELAVLLDARGDSAAALPLYRKLAGLWRSGDENLPILQDTRRRLLGTR